MTPYYDEDGNTISPLVHPVVRPVTALRENLGTSHRAALPFWRGILWLACWFNLLAVVMLTLWPHDCADVTAIASSRLWVRLIVPDAWLPWLMTPACLVSSVLMIWALRGRPACRQGRHTRTRAFLLGILQQMFVLMTAAGSITAVVVGAYADGTMVERQHIFLDQSIWILLAIAHTVAWFGMLGYHREP